MLCDLGCRYVILGHSERRHIFGETDEYINKKVHAALAVGLVPIVCVGEMIAEREAGQTRPSSAASSTARWPGFPHEQVREVVIAYEPVWAIGTGMMATPASRPRRSISTFARSWRSVIMRPLPRPCGSSTAAASSPTTRPSCCGSPTSTGRLVGGASLKADQFLGIVAGA